MKTTAIGLLGLSFLISVTSFANNVDFNLVKNLFDEGSAPDIYSENYKGALTCIGGNQKLELFGLTFVFEKSGSTMRAKELSAKTTYEVKPDDEKKHWVLLDGSKEFGYARAAGGDYVIYIPNHKRNIFYKGEEAVAYCKLIDL